MNKAIENHKKRREQCIKKMKEISGGNKAFMILYSAPERKRNGDNLYKYRFSSDIYFLTGIKDPEVTLLLRTEQPYSVAFVLPKDPSKEVWTGIRKSKEEIKNIYGIDEVYTIDEKEDKLIDLMEEFNHCFISFIDSEMAMNQIPDIITVLNSRKKENPEVGLEIAELLKENITLDSSKASNEFIKKMKNLKKKRRLGVNYPEFLFDAHSLIAKLRKEKNSYEVNAMKEAIRITKDAFINTIKFTKPTMTENEVLAYLEYEFKKRGADDVSFHSIVAGGINATILHYIQHDAELKDNTLLLIDAGTEKNGYAADISRTFPVGKKFSPAQRDVYQAVLEINKKVIEKIKPGIALKELDIYATKLTIGALIDLKILKGDIETLFLLDSCRPFYTHSIGHYLGLDAHDVGSYYNGVDKPEPLTPGTVVTVEPGLYFGKIAEKYTPKELYGIGVRIEDDILVTEEGYENLSIEIPKEIDDIENLKE